MRYGNELREKVGKMFDDKISRKVIHELLGISNKTLSDWKALHKQGKLLENETWKRGFESKIDREKLRKTVEEKPDLYLSELGTIFGVSGVRIGVVLKQMGLNLKKRNKSTKKQIKKIEQDS
jgi:transposase